jgi:hypothetical protein
LSDLANSCEYLNIDKTCAHLSDNPKAKTFRQLKCENSQNVTLCCYLCTFRSQCVTSCKYLGQIENFSKPQNVAENTCTGAAQGLKDNLSQLESVLVAFCFSCNVEMVWTKTQFTIEQWRGTSSSMLTSDDKLLPVTVLLCPKCGKIEFKTDIMEKKR